MVNGSSLEVNVYKYIWSEKENLTKGLTELLVREFLFQTVDAGNTYY